MQESMDCQGTSAGALGLRWSGRLQCHRTYDCNGRQAAGATGVCTAVSAVAAKRRGPRWLVREGLPKSGGKRPSCLLWRGLGHLVVNHPACYSDAPGLA